MGIGKQVAGDEEGFAEVASNDFFFVADGGEVDAGVPAEEYIDVRRYILELGVGQDSRFPTRPVLFGMTRIWNGGQKGLEQFGDAGGVHVEARL
jgi:hypothetical protein